MLEYGEHHWVRTHPSTRLLPQLPWDDDPGPITPMYPPETPCVTRRFRTPGTEYITPSGVEKDANRIDRGGLASGIEYITPTGGEVDANPVDRGGLALAHSLSIFPCIVMVPGKQRTPLPNHPGILVIKQLVC
jgi:hypothetical protein